MKLEERLLMETNGLKIEVINLGMTAVNSFVIWDLSSRLIEYDPDAIIIYAGHNEYYGSFGAGSTQFGFGQGVGLKRLILNLKNWRLYQLIEQLMKSVKPAGNDGRTMMAKVVKDAGIELNGDLFDAGIEQFEKNIGDVVEILGSNDIPLYIGTVASNLKDQPPLSDNAEAIEKYEEALSLYEDGDTESSLKFFLQAKELDELRFRASEQLNASIQRLSKPDNVFLVDVEEMLRRNSQSGIEGESLFVDHLHPNSRGHKLIADLYFEHLLKREEISDRYSPNVFDTPNGITRFEQIYAKVNIDRLLVGYPFQKGLSRAEENRIFENLYNNLLKSSYIDSLAAFSKVNLESVPEALNQVVDHEKREGDTLSVMSHYYELLNWQLNSINLIELAIEYGVNNPEVETYLVNIIEKVLNKGAYDPRYMNVLSAIYLNNRAPEKAKYWLDESLRLKSTEPILFYNLTRYYFLKSDTAKANVFYNRFLQARQR